MILLTAGKYQPTMQTAQAQVLVLKPELRTPAYFGSLANLYQRSAKVMGSDLAVHVASGLQLTVIGLMNTTLLHQGLDRSSWKPPNRYMDHSE